MGKIEISGNLENEDGLNYKLFYCTVNKVLDLFFKEFKEELENPIDLLIDNATSGSGPTPIITPVVSKYLIIKLGIGRDDLESRIAFQISHELMHYIFYIKKGLDKSKADFWEESICAAVSLITINELYPCEFELYYMYMKNLKTEMYRRGTKVAEEVEFSFEKLKRMI